MWMSQLCKVTSLDFQTIAKTGQKPNQAGLATWGGLTLAWFSSAQFCLHRMKNRSGPVTQFCVNRPLVDTPAMIAKRFYKGQVIMTWNMQHFSYCQPLATVLSLQPLWTGVTLTLLLEGHCPDCAHVSLTQMYHSTIPRYCQHFSKWMPLFMWAGLFAWWPIIIIYFFRT